MAYKTILLHLHDPARASAMLDAVMPLASAHESHLIGLNVLPPYVVVPSLTGGATVVADEHRRRYSALATQLRTQFEKSANGQTFQSEWIAADADFGSAAETIVSFGRSADLIVAGQRDPDWTYSDHLEQPDRLVLESGRPVLLLPKARAPGPFGSRIVIAWNGRREAARAAFDALPFLKRARDVIIVWVNPQEEGGRAGDLPGLDIATALARHGVTCEATQNIRPSTDVASTLLGAVKSHGADMLVMGCYGHSRFTEFVFGGATRQILQTMTVPVLMSH